MFPTKPAPASTFNEVAAAHRKATSGEWTWNCASEIFALIDGEDVRIGHFQGCAADAEAVCRLHNTAVRLLSAAGSLPSSIEEGKEPLIQAEPGPPPDIYQRLTASATHLFSIQYPGGTKRAGIKVDDVGIVAEATPAFKWAVGVEFETVFDWCGKRSLKLVKAHNNCKSLHSLMKRTRVPKKASSDGRPPVRGLDLRPTAEVVA